MKFSFYDTHFFRKSDVQYLFDERRWNIRKLCDWNDWNLNFDNFIIVRYLWDWNDDSIHKRENFMNFHVKIEKKCNYCERIYDHVWFKFKKQFDNHAFLTKKTCWNSFIKNMFEFEVRRYKNENLDRE